MSDDQKTEGEGNQGGEAQPQTIQTEQPAAGAQPAALSEQPAAEEKPAEGDKAE